VVEQLTQAIGEQLRDGGDARFLDGLPDELLDRHELPPLPR